MSTIRAIIFDMDGVLIDAKQWHYEAFNRALGLFGFAISPFEHVSRYDGLPTRRKLQMLTQDREFPQSLHDFVHRMKQIYTLDLAEQYCRPDPLHVDTLRRLRQDGYCLGLASNSIRRTVDVLMEKSQLAHFLKFTISNEDVQRPKPDPEIYHRAIELAGCRPDECLVVEDNAHGIAAAEASGAYVLKVQTVRDVNYARIQAEIFRIGGIAGRQVA